MISIVRINIPRVWSDDDIPEVFFNLCSVVSNYLMLIKSVRKKWG